MEPVTSPPTRPQHRRNASSKSNVFKALVPSRHVPSNASPSSPSKQHTQSHALPLLPPDHPHAAKGRVLGERNGNMQSPPSSPAKRRPRVAPSKTSNDLPTLQTSQKASTEEAGHPKKSKSSTNLAGMLARKNRSAKDLSQPVEKDKENTTPPSSSNGPAHTPIWAQFATTAQMPPLNDTGRDQTSNHLKDEIAKYTPQDYSPSKQRNFNGTFDQPQLRPTTSNRPQSMYAIGADIVGTMGRRLSGDRSNAQGRKSEDLERQRNNDNNKRHSGEQTLFGRKVSGSSMEHAPAKEKLNIAKRGGRVMAAVAALQGKGPREPTTTAEEPSLDPKAVDAAFEAVLDSRNIPEPMRQKMRSLTMRVKADFIKQDQGAAKGVSNDPAQCHSLEISTPRGPNRNASKAADDTKNDDDATSTKRSRARTFTFSKSDKAGDTSPSKKQRSSSKSRSTSTHVASIHTSTAPSTPRGSLDKRRSAGPAAPAEFISYLRKNQNPTTVEVGRLHRLRILLRNETVAWVDTFISLGGMAEIVGLLHRIMGLEWREEHEDQLLHETLLCLKGLCTTERAMVELEKVADTLFRPLMDMLYDDEKKGPAEYTTRAIIITVLFNYLAAATSFSSEALEQRARQVLTYVGEPAQPEDARPVNFVLDMRTARPYKLWCREITHVTKEVFWIFLHHLNVIPLPKDKEKDKSDTSLSSPLTEADATERAKVLAATYTHRHFPGTRPPIPAAPYIGGVEWDATTYLTAHLDLLNGLLACIPSVSARNALRTELRASGFEKILGTTLRTCKEKFYVGVHDGLRAWVAAAAEDGWETRMVCEGPTQEELARDYSPKKSAKKADVAPRLDLKIAGEEGGGGKPKDGEKIDGDDGGWLG